MVIRKYTPIDKSEVIALFQGNTPTFFHPSEEGHLRHYLDHETEDYYIVEEGSKIMGAGGINYFPKERTARISWDLIAPEAQGMGIGRKLMQHRLQQLAKQENIDTVVVRTSQLVFRFYESMGFSLEKIERDYWAKDLHLYQMILKNNPHEKD